MSKSENPPAFPSEQHECADGSWNQTYDPGMSLRDWFAGQALAGMLACPTMDGDMRNEQYACISYAIADAMLAEREKGGAA